MRTLWVFILAGLTFSCGSRAPAVTIAASRDVAAPTEDVHVEAFPCSAYAPDGLSPDATKARTCLEREVENDRCENGSSPSLARLELAVSMIDGTGGPRDSKRGLALLDGCFADASVEAIRDHAAKSTEPLSSCDAFAMTTLATSECLAEHTENEKLWLRLAKRKLPNERVTLFANAARAYDAYTEKVGTISYTLYREGTMRDPAMRTVVVGMMKRRRMRLERLMQANYVPPTPEITTHAIAKTRESDAEMQSAIEDAEAAWPTYRDAEIALYESYRPGARNTIVAILEMERIADFRDARRDDDAR